MHIEHQCPQCGAPVVLDETDRLLTCGFCRTKLYMQTPDYFRYCMNPRDPFLDTVLYVPYWRFRGMHFVCRTEGISETVVDKTNPAIAVPGFPQSLGIRPQTLTVRFARNGENTRFLRPAIPFDKTAAEIKKLVAYEVIRIAETRLVDLGGDNYAEVPGVRFEIKEDRLYHQSFVADAVSLIYAPYYMRDGKIFDGMTDQVLPGVNCENIGTLETMSGDWPVSFLPTICPICGSDTTGEKDSCVMLCLNCNRAWDIHGIEPCPVRFAVAESKIATGAPAVYLPFWCIRPNITGITLRSYADLMRFSNISWAIRPQWETRPFQLWIPATKAPPSVFLRSARQFTITDLSASGEDLPHDRILPVNLPLSDAIDSAKVVIANLAFKKKEIFPRLPEIEFHDEDTLLVLIPFTENAQEYIQPDINYAIMKNALMWGKNI
ncbi:MAG: hypothetical protein ABFD12_03665 [Syntrophorhabdus sp.]